MMLKKYSTLFLLVAVVGFFVGKHLYMKPKFNGGETAPSFTAKTISGENLSLKNLQGKYVLIDFWGTWCGPCMQEVPDLKKMYAKYHGKQFKNANNFEVVSIALEKEGTEARWQKAIQRLGLNWEYHIFDAVTNFKFLDAKIASETYGVKEVPTKYLINPDGYIMGVNLPFEEMDMMLEKQLK